MKKRGRLFLISFSIVLMLTGCSSSEKEVHGTWYVDSGDVRNIIQFYENDNTDTDNAFIWAVYDIAADERSSVETGTYAIGDGTITFSYASGIVVTLEYTKNGDRLTLVMDGAAVEFQLFELADTTAEK